MRAVDVIRLKRDGGELTPAAIESFVAGAARGQGWESYQLTALLMAIYLRGMSETETAHLTRAMAESGRVLDLSDIPGPKVDKHSTGGVGDKASLVVGPVAAACGVVVPMMSGRGLGHSGGTLDKLEAIPGFRVGLSEEQIRVALRRVGLVMVGQTAEVAPADRTLYALRDVTATVESVPLITASILSKKLAEGISGLVLDVKCGRGAFMKTPAAARELARSLVQVGTTNGLRVRAVLTAMDAPLGRAVGNALEVAEAVEVLKGRGPDDLRELCLDLAARMLQLAGREVDERAARRRASDVLTSGAALEVFRRCIAEQGGDPRVLDDDSRLPRTEHTTTIRADRPGFIVEMDAYTVGMAAMRLGGGRARAEDTVDPAVGVVCRAKPPDPVRAGDVVYEVHYRSPAELPAIHADLQRSFVIAETPPSPSPLVIDEVG